MCVCAFPCKVLSVLLFRLASIVYKVQAIVLFGFLQSRAVRINLFTIYSRTLSSIQGVSFYSPRSPCLDDISYQLIIATPVPLYFLCSFFFH